MFCKDNLKKKTKTIYYNKSVFYYSLKNFNKSNTNNI